MVKVVSKTKGQTTSRPARGNRGCASPPSTASTARVKPRETLPTLPIKTRAEGVLRSRNPQLDATRGERYRRQPRTTSTTLARSASVKLEPEGRHSHCSNNSAATPPPTLSQPAKTGCKCMGFQTGRASIFSASRARRKVARSARCQAKAR